MAPGIVAALDLQPVQIYAAARGLQRLRTGKAAKPDDGLPAGFRRGTPEEFKAMIMGARVG